MLFNSFVFWTFFAIVIVLYRGLGHKWQNRMLLVASYIFYGAWDWRFLSLILISTAIDYYVAIGIARSSDQKRKFRWCMLSVCSNLGILGVFKYYGFFAGEMVALLSWLGLNVTLPSLNIVLPVGISFYTFQTMSYTIDVYRGAIKPVYNFWDFALYVSYFPQLVAGPIERSSNLLPQIITPRTSNPDDFSEGLYLVLMGLFKKVIMADNLAIIVNVIFSADPNTLTGAECLIGVYAFAFQIYGDFSGYSDIARGISRWMGIKLMVNFKMPYLAKTPSDFWRRWHISLSTWLRDYLYVTLGGNRYGKWMTYRNLMLTMLLGGLWHGAGWTFIAWGFFHGLILIIYRPFEGKSKDAETNIWKSALAIVIMFHLVCVSWLLFRAQSMGQVWIMFSQIATNHEFSALAQYGLALIAFYAGPLMLFEYWVERSKDLTKIVKIRWWLRAAVYSYMVLMLLIFQPEVRSEFIYFQF